jgi:hypothetical protein
MCVYLYFKTRGARAQSKRPAGSVREDDGLAQQSNFEKDKLRLAECQIEELERDMSLKNDEVFFLQVLYGNR